MKKFFGVISAAVALAVFNSCGNDSGSGAAGGGRFFLMDQRTQIPVMSCPVPPGWFYSGKCTWTTDPAVPVNWYFWTMSPDRREKIIVSSQIVIPSMAPINRTPMLQQPEILANTLLPSVQRDHGLTTVSLAEAKFIPSQPDRKLLEARLRQAQERGIRITDIRFAELSIRYSGSADGEARSVIMSLPMLSSESQATAMSRTTVTEILLPMSFSCPPDQEEQTKKFLTDIVSGMQMNPNFIQVVNTISAQRTANWLRVQNEIREQQFEVAATTAKTQDRVRDMWSEYIRDVDPVANPNTGEKMFLDNRYDHAWINSENEVMYQNSGATFDPNTDKLFNHTNWKQLK